MDIIYKAAKWLGINNRAVSFRGNKEGELDAAENCFIDDTGALHRREGYRQVSSGAAHSLYADGDICLFRRGSELRRFYPDQTERVLLSDCPVGSRMAYRRVGSQTYMTDGARTLRTDGLMACSLGIEPPGGQPVARSAAYGDLPLGDYQVACTFLRTDGEESGTGIAAMVYNAQGGIAFSQIPYSLDPTVASVALYMSRAGGKTLYRVATVTNGTSTYTYTGTTIDATLVLETLGKYPAPAGRIISDYHGRVLIADGPHLHYSDPYRHGLFDPTGFYTFTAHIRAMAPADDGVWVGTENQILFLAGTDVAQSKATPIAPYGIAEGGMVQIDPARLSKANAGPHYYAASDRGIVLLMNGGAFQSMTGGDYEFGNAQRAAMTYWPDSAAHKVVTSLFY